jgi:hypothetical protein
MCAGPETRNFFVNCTDPNATLKTQKTWHSPVESVPAKPKSRFLAPFLSTIITLSWENVPEPHLLPQAISQAHHPFRSDILPLVPGQWCELAPFPEVPDSAVPHFHQSLRFPLINHFLKHGVRYREVLSRMIKHQRLSG